MVSRGPPCGGGGGSLGKAWISPALTLEDVGEKCTALDLFALCALIENWEDYPVSLLALSPKSLRD